MCFETLDLLLFLESNTTEAYYSITALWKAINYACMVEEAVLVCFTLLCGTAPPVILKI